MAGAATILNNQTYDQLATKLPISGVFDKTKIDLWETIGGVLEIAFVRALRPTSVRSVRLKDLEQNRSHPAKDSKAPCHGSCFPY